MASLHSYKWWQEIADGSAPFLTLVSLLTNMCRSNRTDLFQVWLAV
jgi:hypothetical protein